MAKGKKTVFFCQNCGYESSKWQGQCPGCHEWNTFVEETVSTAGAGKKSIGQKTNFPIKINEVSADSEARVTTDIAELDRVLGGGIVPGSMTLVGGDPGIGKSTLLLQVCKSSPTRG